jgi:hypothetical protein
MASVIRAFGFSNSLQQLVWPTTTSQITAYVWGGGGGGGGNDAGSPGGVGGGAGFSRKTFTINNGDILQVAVAGAGGAGATSQNGAPGGGAGASYTASTIWTSLNLLSNPINQRVTNSAYVGFLNQYGVWNYTPSATYFDQTVTVNFPSSGYYNFIGSCDNYATIYIDGSVVLDIPGFRATYSNSVYVTAGNHSLRLYGVNTGGPGSIGVTINGGASFGGGNGSAAGVSSRGFSGGGGGGGGASVVLLNGTPISIAGGGAGGGGAGNDGGGGGRGNAPGPSGQTSTGIYAGQNGEPKSGDGGGAGGGGGGYAGGNGGPVVGGDQTGYAGFYGSSLGDVVANPSGRTPGGTNQPYYSGSVGYGGVNTNGGSSGYVVLDMAVGGASVKFNGNWESVQRTYIKTNGVWQPVQATYVKDNGTWSPISGSFAPTFTTVVGNWGSDPRSY